MFRHVKTVLCQKGYKLRLTFDDDAVKIVDLANELDGPVFEPLIDPTFFARVRVNNDTGTIEWPNGADMAPEFLYEIGRPAEDGSVWKVAESCEPYCEA